MDRQLRVESHPEIAEIVGNLSPAYSVKLITEYKNSDKPAIFLLFGGQLAVTRVFFTLCWAWAACEMLLQLLMYTSSNSGKVRDRGSLLVLIASIYAAI